MSERKLPILAANRSFFCTSSGRGSTRPLSINTLRVMSSRGQEGSRTAYIIDTIPSRFMKAVNILVTVSSVKGNNLHQDRDHHPAYHASVSHHHLNKQRPSPCLPDSYRICAISTPSYLGPGPRCWVMFPALGTRYPVELCSLFAGRPLREAVTFHAHHNYHFLSAMTRTRGTLAKDETDEKSGTFTEA
jgi:hypothetical protein